MLGFVPNLGKSPSLKRGRAHLSKALRPLQPGLGLDGGEGTAAGEKLSPQAPEP